MEPLSIICETCRARLKIRSASAVGEIHACPRCGSMVMVVPPPGWSASDAASPETEVSSLTTVSPAAVEATSSTMQFIQVESPSEAAADAFAEAAALAAHPGVVEVAPHDTVSEIASTVEPTSGALSTWMLGGGVVAAVLVVAALGVVMLKGDSAVEIEVAPPSATSAADVVEVADSDSSHYMETTTEDNSPADASVRVALKPALGSEEQSLSDADMEPLVDNSTDATDSVEPESDQATEADRTAKVAATQTPESTPAPTADKSGSARPAVLRFDPLDFDPDQLTLGSAVGLSDDPASASVPANIGPGGDAPAVAIESEQELADLSEMPGENPSVTVRLGPVARGETNPVRVARQLGVRVESLSATGMSLEQFVAFVSNLAAVPITIDPLALELAGVSPRSAVAVQTSGVTLQQLAQSGLSKQRLELVDHNGQLGIALANGDERSTKRYDVSDLLAAGADNASDVARIIERFVSPDAWRAAGSGTIEVEGKKLRVDQAKNVHHELLIFCERWRLTRGLKQRSQYPASRLSVESPHSQVFAKLSEHATFTLLPWTRLDDVVHHWEQSTGLTILVDWSQLAAEELAPSTPIACSAVDRPWNEALAEIFEPLGLAWWAVDSQTIQITTTDALDTIQRTEFYRLPVTMREQFVSKDAFLASLQSELQEHVGGRAGNQPPLLHVDAPSRRLIVRATPIVHQYLSERLNGKSTD